MQRSGSEVALRNDAAAAAAAAAVTKQEVYDSAACYDAQERERRRHDYLLDALCAPDGAVRREAHAGLRGTLERRFEREIGGTAGYGTLFARFFGSAQRQGDIERDHRVCAEVAGYARAVMQCATIMHATLHEPTFHRFLAPAECSADGGGGAAGAADDDDAVVDRLALGLFERDFLRRALDDYFDGVNYAFPVMVIHLIAVYDALLPADVLKRPWRPEPARRFVVRPHRTAAAAPAPLRVAYR